ncbi:hypothetical protein BGZ46_003201 [Entomortierella lignicola]|nr:hypothetical protein BGZ46_003201 [Entomortierella lignicola]
MKFTILSTLSLLSLGLIGSEAATNIVRINAETGLVCLILPPRGQIIGNTQTIGHVQCTDGTPELLPTDFFVSKTFQTTSDYVTAWGLMNDAAVGMLTSDGGGQYDIHPDSGDNAAQGYPVFVELLEPDTGRWCIRFCHTLGDHACNMGNSDKGCEGALNITSWPTGSPSGAGAAATTTSLVHGNATATGTAKATGTASAANATITGAATTTAASAAGASSTTKSNVSGAIKSSFGSVVPLTILASALYYLF